MATKIQSPKIMKIETIQMQWQKYDQFQKKIGIGWSVTWVSIHMTKNIKYSRKVKSKMLRCND